MSREYETRKVLVWIVCDRCGAKIASSSTIAESGWVTHGQHGPGDQRFEWDYCPHCANHR